jgi:hypothetical protein
MKKYVLATCVVPLIFRSRSTFVVLLRQILVQIFRFNIQIGLHFGLLLLLVYPRCLPFFILLGAGVIREICCAIFYSSSEFL